jgi:hypothetical protein
MRNGNRLSGLKAATIILGCLSFQTASHAQSCDSLKNTGYTQGQLYAISSRNESGKPILLKASEFSSTELTFDPRISLIYVLDNPVGARTDVSGIRREFSGVIAVRLVSTGIEGKERQPTYVYLKRDSIASRGGAREAWSGSVSAKRYYAYHHPRALRASDSLLEREFHSEYTYRQNEPDRSTYDQRDRRRQFHFPEMKATEPTDAPSRLISSLFGSGTALAAVPESRFEAQIKYYRQDVQPRCLALTTGIGTSDNATLKITMIDLDHPYGLDSSASTETWQIIWRKPR